MCRVKNGKDEVSARISIEQREQVMQCSFHIGETFGMVCFNGNNSVGGIGLSSALLALSTAPATRNDETRFN